MSMRSHTCGQVTDLLIGQEITLAGWVNRRRDHGGVIFIDLRDHQGFVQVVCDPDRPDMFKQAEEVRNEFCIQIKGLVRARPAGTENLDLISGKVEILCHELKVLNASVTPPFQLDDDNLSETTRLTHRVLDLRRPQMQKNLRLRYQVAMETRRYLDAAGFIDIETPMLTKSTPEGARDYLVPSRVHDGQFFALPQSPQLFKQLLMVAGFDRYYQITKCFRDEDLRADRQPEFTQIDCETAFLDEIEIRNLFETMMRHIFKTVMNVDLPNPFMMMPYSESMARFGSDKPDLRIAMEFTELTDLMRDVDFKVFSGPANQEGGRVVALCVSGGAEISRSEIDDYTQFVSIYGAKGLAWIKVNSVAEGRNGLQSPIVKNLHDAAIEGILKRTNAKDGDLIFFGADKIKKDEHLKFLETDPGKCLAKAYDMVLNGSEIGGGSVRIHQESVQSQVFRALKIGPEEANAKFGFLLDALQYGAPPHGGIAFGLDRIVTMMTGAESIRDVIAFPKTQRAQCLLTQAPSPVDERQLRELHIRLRNTNPVS